MYQHIGEDPGAGSAAPANLGGNFDQGDEIQLIAAITFRQKNTVKPTANEFDLGLGGERAFFLSTLRTFAQRGHPIPGALGHLFSAGHRSLPLYVP
jgi:hypothetical protein